MKQTCLTVLLPGLQGVEGTKPRSNSALLHGLLAADQALSM